MIVNQLSLKICVYFFLVVSGVVSAPLVQAGESNLKGDPIALKQVSQMIQKLGGTSAWADSESLYVMQKARYPRIGDGILSTRWLNLQSPGERGELKHPRLNIEFAWNQDQGWVGRNEDFRDFISDEIAEKSFYWSRDIFVLIHDLARAEKSYRVEGLKPRGFRVFDEKSRKVGEVFLTADGEVYRFVQLGGKKAHTFLFGPYKSFGQINFPDWSASADGDWGAYYLQFLPSERPFNEQVSMEKPVKEWHGGAVKSNCNP